MEVKSFRVDMVWCGDENRCYNDTIHVHCRYISTVRLGGLSRRSLAGGAIRSLIQLLIP